jgi:copper chaperone CopZ
MEQIALEISPMEGAECERVVTSALINVPGVYWATADHATGMVGISYDPAQVDSNELRDAVSVAGYTTLEQ